MSERKYYHTTEPLYGQELLLDLHNCDVSMFTRKSIEKYFIKLCALIGMEREDLHWWDDEDTPQEYKETEPHLVGISAIQFIKTSNITIHSLEKLGNIYINIFSCKYFNPNLAAEFTKGWFKGDVVNQQFIGRM